MQYGWYDLVGNVGVLLILGTYLLLQTEKISARKLQYSLLNAIGAVLVIVSLIFNFNLSSMIIEVVWLAISAIGVVRVLQRVRE